MTLVEWQREQGKGMLSWTLLEAAWPTTLLLFNRSQSSFAAHFSILWHSRRMKALKSQLASELLADPKARDQLRQFMIAKRLGSAAAQRQPVNDVIGIQRESGGSVTAVLVPKAKTA